MRDIYNTRKPIELTNLTLKRIIKKKLYYQNTGEMRCPICSKHQRNELEKKKFFFFHTFSRKRGEREKEKKNCRDWRKQN